MQLSTITSLRSIYNILGQSNNNSGIKTLFVLDSFLLCLFAIVLLGVADHLPTLFDVLIQSLFVALTLILTFCFIKRRLIGMVILKLSMLFVLYLFAAIEVF